MTNNKNINNELINSDDIRGFIKCQIKPWVLSPLIDTIYPCDLMKQLMNKFYPGWLELDILEQIKRLEQINTILEQETGLSAKN